MVILIALLAALAYNQGMFKTKDDEFAKAKEAFERLEKRDDLEKATVAGGCFWCTEAAFEQLEGVTDVLAGYTGGSVENPTYKQVVGGTTGHRESVRIYFDPKIVSYSRILEIYWLQINPTDAGGQFVDRGEQYTTAIYYHSDEQKKLAGQSKSERENSGTYDEPIVTEILPASKFYVAEDYHQSYYITSEGRYKIYERGSGRQEYRESIRN